MPALTFRRKLVLAFLLVIVGAVGASLWVVFRQHRADLDRRMRDETAHVQETHRQSQKVQEHHLVWGCRVIAEQPRFRATLESAVSGDWDTDNLRYFASQYYEKTGIDFFSIIDAASGRCVLRAFEGKEPAGPSEVPEAELARRALSTIEGRIQAYQSAPTDAAREKAAATLKETSAASGHLLDGDRLYQVVALPVQSEDAELTSPPVGAMVVGVRVSPRALDDMRRVVGKGAVFALVIGDRLAMASGMQSDLPSSGLSSLVERALASGGRLEVGGDHPHFLVASPPEGLLSPSRKRATVAILVRLSTEEERERFLVTTRYLLLAGLGVVIVAALVATGMAAGMARPILDLVAGTRRVAKGDYGVEVPVRTRDELGTLAAAFNEMTKGLADRERYRTVLTKVVSKEVAHELMSQMRGRGLDYEGVGRLCTMLFSDIRGFTPLTEHMAPADVISMLNEHMAAMVRTVERHRGVVNKFVGDEVIGVFGAPVEHDDDALWAVRAGMEMVAERKRLNASRAAQGKKEFPIGIGINTGNVICGVMGSQERAEYAVLGAPVNLTARLCSAAKPMQVIITQATFDRVKDQVEVVPLGEQSFKGFSEPIPVYEVRSVRPSIVPQTAGTRS